MIIFRGETDRLELMTAARRFTPELIHSNILHVVKLSYDTAVVKVLVEFLRILKFPQYSCGHVWSSPWSCVGIL